MAAPRGNQNAAKAKVWSAAIDRALEKRCGGRVQALDELAEKLLRLCDEGDLAALQELGNRLEGKPSQQMLLTGAEGGPIETVTKIERRIVHPNSRK